MSDINTLDNVVIDDDVDILGQIDMTKEQSEGTYPPPPPAGDYRLKYELAGDPEKAIVLVNNPAEPEKIKAELNDGKPYVSVKLVATVVEALGVDDPLQYTGRKVFQGLNLTSIQREDGTTKLTNWMKSITSEIEAIPKSFNGLRQWIIEEIGAGAEGDAHLDWEARGKKEDETYLPDWGFFIEDKKAAKSYPSSMKRFPQNEDGSYADTVVWTDPRDGEEVQLKAASKVVRFFSRSASAE